jgi:hypothetical protein
MKAQFVELHVSRREPPDVVYLHIIRLIFKQTLGWIVLSGSLVTTAWSILRVADGGEGLQIWRVAANILNKQSRTPDKGWPSGLGVGRGANNAPP